MSASTFVRASLAVAAKDLAIEWKTKTAFVSSMVFAVLVLAVLYFARDPTSVATIDVAPTAIFVGKVIGNLVFVGAVELASVPLFILFYDLPIGAQLPELLLVMIMATVAFVAVGTLLSAMVVRTRFAELMLPVLLLPFLVPPVVGAVQLTARILLDRPLSELAGWLKLLAAFDLVFLTLSILLFEATLEE